MQCQARLKNYRTLLVHVPPRSETTGLTVKLSAYIGSTSIMCNDGCQECHICLSPKAAERIHDGYAADCPFLAPTSMVLCRVDSSRKGAFQSRLFAAPRGLRCHY